MKKTCQEKDSGVSLCLLQEKTPPPPPKKITSSHDDAQLSDHAILD